MEALAEVLEFWFGSEADDAEIAAAKGPLWFGKSDETDRKIRERFGRLVEQAAEGVFNARLETPHQRLAVIILLDQFSRNIYRGQSACFSSDPLALQLALDGLALGEDKPLRPIERVFFYLPLEHSEQLEMQDRSVQLFADLVDEVPMDWQKLFSGFLDYAVRHRDIIVRFGRYPHRNAILGRLSTAEEIAFLSQPGSSF